MLRLDWEEIVRLKDEEDLTFEQIAQRVGKTKGSVYNAYQRAKQEGSKPAVYQASKPESKPPPRTDSKPAVYQGSKPPSKPTPKAEQGQQVVENKLESLLPVLEEIASWWMERKKALSKPSVYPNKRQTYILSQDLIDGIREHARERGITITEAANEVVRKGLAER